MSDTEQHDATLDEETPAPKPQSRGLIDGSLNNLHAADRSNILGAMLNSKVDDASNNNANTRNEGNRNNAING